MYEVWWTNPYIDGRDLVDWCGGILIIMAVAIVLKGIYLKRKGYFDQDKKD